MMPTFPRSYPTTFRSDSVIAVMSAAALPPKAEVPRHLATSQAAKPDPAPQQTIQKATRAIDPLLRDTDLFHHRLPQLLFPADEFSRLGWRHRPREGSEVGKPLPEFWVIENGSQVMAHLAHDPIRCTGRREQREPTGCHESGNCFSDCRQVRKVRQPLRGGNRDRFERAALNGAQQGSQALHDHRDATAYQILQSGRRTGVR